ncbi:MAG: Bor family protein [Candidatus Cloacimonetes bacterium]|nr:Bor family protein [Candidatus Cloacimonadota bacterium]
MLKKGVMLTIALILLLSLIACSTHVHTVGRGPQTGQEVQARQWYILWGLVPINTVDTYQMVAGATDYEIKTEQSFLDVVINFFTSSVTVYSRTVTVKNNPTIREPWKTLHYFLRS